MEKPLAISPWANAGQLSNKHIFHHIGIPLLKMYVIPLPILAFKIILFCLCSLNINIKKRDSTAV